LVHSAFGATDVTQRSAQPAPIVEDKAMLLRVAEDRLGSN